MKHEGANEGWIKTRFTLKEYAVLAEQAAVLDHSVPAYVRWQMRRILRGELVVPAPKGGHR